LAHPELDVVALGSDSLAGEPAAALDLRLNGHLPAFVPNDEALAAGADVVFLCLSHERAAAVEPAPGAVVVDLSGAHRLADAELYPAWYGFEHPRPETLAAGGSPPATRRRRRTACARGSRTYTRRARSCGCFPRASSRSWRACSTPTRPRSRSSRTAPRAARSSSARSTTSGRARRARPSRTRTWHSASNRRTASA